MAMPALSSARLVEPGGAASAPRPLRPRPRLDPNTFAHRLTKIAHAKLMALLLGLLLVSPAATEARGLNPRQSAAEGELPNACALIFANAASNASVSPDVSILYDFCVSDADCSAAYHLDANARLDSAGVFAHLLAPRLAAEPLLSPLAEIACAGDTSVSLRRVWLLVLLSNMRVPACEIDHVYRYDAETGHQGCVCLPDRPCSKSTVDQWPLYVVFVLLAVVSVAALIIVVVTGVTLLRKLSLVVGDEAAGLRAIFAAGARG